MSVNAILLMFGLFKISLAKLSGATDWCVRWKKNGWKTVNGTEVKNKNEFQKLAKLCDEIDVKWVSCVLESIFAIKSRVLR